MSPGGVVRLGVGLAALGRPAYINLGRSEVLPAERSVEAMRAACWEVLDLAYAAGIRWMDVARSYGRAEEFLAGWLEARGRKDITVSSKWGYTYVGDWRLDAKVHEVKEHSLARFRSQLAETRGLLGARLALYQVHSLTSDSPLFTDRELLTALAELAGAGTRVGFSTSGPGQADTVAQALELEIEGRRLFTAVQATWNLLEPSVATQLARAHAAGLHVLVKEALANGRLAIRPPDALARLAAKHRAGPDALALAAALDQPWADTVLLGPASGRQLQSNLAAAGIQLDDADRTELASLRLPAAEYWKQRSELPWT
jgi:aryl-alcohol dehydrogenase-like predicted oxidoreductase